MQVSNGATGARPTGKKMKASSLLLSSVILLALAGCDRSEPEAQGTTEPVPPEAVDQDPTPQTGTGGPSETAAPDATVNGAPGAQPAQN